MKIGFVCNDCTTETANYTTTRLGLSALEMGHEPWLIGVGDFINDTDGAVRAWARAAPRKSYRSTRTYLADVQLILRLPAVARASATCRTPCRLPPRRCWPMPGGERSAGAPGRKASSAHASQLCGSVWLTTRRSRFGAAGRSTC